jgi:hypothetical protein
MSMCMRRGCRLPGTHAPKIVVPDKVNPTRTACEAVIAELQLCATHATKFTADSLFLANPAMQQIMRNAAAAATADPDFENAYVETVAIGTPEHSAHLAATRPN